MSFLCACSSRFGSMGPERRKNGPGGGIPDSFGSSGGRIRRRGMAESQMDIMDRSNLFLLKKAEKNSISCVDKDDKTISCVFFVNPMKGCGKVGKMCLIYGENVDIMVVTSGFCLVFTAIQND